jgi:hypothetical protein
MDETTGRSVGVFLVSCVPPGVRHQEGLYPKGDGGLGTLYADHIDREGSRECVKTHKNRNSSSQQLTIMCKYLDLLAEDVMLQLVLLVKYKFLLEKCRCSEAKITVAA